MIRPTIFVHKTKKDLKKLQDKKNIIEIELKDKKNGTDK